MAMAMMAVDESCMTMDVFVMMACFGGWLTR
jgi:hypothetical protein